MQALNLVDVVKEYRQGAEKIYALDRLNLAIEEGTFTAVIGASGSGKSTLLHVAGGMDRPDGGRVLLDGRDLASLGRDELAVVRRRRIGFVFQFYNLIPLLSAEENILLPLLLDDAEPDRALLEELLGLLGLKTRRNHLPSQLSGGQQQRVAVARALITRPAIILADEPTGNLDSESGREVIELLIHGVRVLGQTLMLVTHDRDLAADADRIIRLADGKIAADTEARV